MTSLRGYLRSPVSLARNLAWHFIAPTSASDHVFVVGAPRSGTTLTQLLIGSQPGFFTYPWESGIFTWRNLFEKDRAFGVGAVKYATSILAKCKNKVEFYEAMVDFLNENSSSIRCVEKTPAHVKHLPYLLDRFPNAKIVNVVRDGRDCYCSARAVRSIPQGRDVRIFAGYWSRMLRFREKVAGSHRVTDVRYETLVASPETEMRRIMSFLGSTLDEAGLQPEVYLAGDARHTLPEFSMLSSPVSTGSVGRWRQEMTDAENSSFIAIAGRDLERYGYGLGRLS